MDVDLLIKPEPQILNIDIELLKNLLELRYVTEYVTEISQLSKNKSYYDFELSVIKMHFNNLLLDLKDSNINFNDSKCTVRIIDEVSDEIETKIFSFLELINLEDILKASIILKKRLALNRKYNEKLESQIEEMKKEKIIFAGYQTPIIKEMKLKANQ